MGPVSAHAMQVSFRSTLHTPPPPPSPFTVTPALDDTALVRDARTPFSHLLPGHPSIAPPQPEPAGAPPADVVVLLRDAPITIRYRLEWPTFRAANAFEVARVTAEGLAGSRASLPIAADHANPTWLAAWGIDAAAVARYDLAGAREDLFVLVRAGLVMTVRWTYPRAFLDDPVYATFASIAEATMVWDPERCEQRGRVWPESNFVTRGLRGGPKLRWLEAAQPLAGALSGLTLSGGERAQLVSVLAGIVAGAGAPWVPVSVEALRATEQAILNVTQHPRVRGFVEQALAEVSTAHDLRAAAVLLGRVVCYTDRPSGRARSASVMRSR